MTDEKMLRRFFTGELFLTKSQAIDALDALVQDRDSWKRIALSNGRALDACYEQLQKLNGVT